MILAALFALALGSGQAVTEPVRRVAGRPAGHSALEHPVVAYCGRRGGAVAAPGDGGVPRHVPPSSVRAFRGCAVRVRRAGGYRDGLTRGGCGCGPVGGCFGPTGVDVVGVASGSGPPRRW